MKIAFINVSLRPGSVRKQLPVGLAYIMTAVKKAGFDFDLIDMDIVDMSLEDLEKVLSEKTYDVYALGCIVTGFAIVRKVSEMIKRINPQSLIVAGNSVATSVPELLLQKTKVDIAVLREGDITVVDLLKTLEKKAGFKDVNGIAFRENGSIHITPERPFEPSLDPFGFPDWKLFDLEKYNEYGKVNYNVFESESALGYPLNSARGCPFSCTFCYHVFRGKAYRCYSDQAVVDEIKRLHYEYGANFISFWDELTFPNIKRVKELIEQFSKLEFKFGWDAPCRAGVFKKDHVEIVKDLKGVGCDNISFSLENGDPGILIAMNKKITVEQFVEQAETLWKGGVTPLTSVVLGYPQETPETIKTTIDICEQCNIFPSVGFLLPLPGTPIYDWARENGHIPDEVEYLERIGDRQDFHINLTSMSDDEFVGTVTENLEALAKKQGLEVESVFKTGTYKKPENV